MSLQFCFVNIRFQLNYDTMSTNVASFMQSVQERVTKVQEDQSWKSAKHPK